MAENQKIELNENELESVAGGVNAGGASGNAVGVKPGGVTGIKKYLNNTGTKSPMATGGSKGTMSKGAQKAL